MDYNNNKIETLQHVLYAVQKADLPPVQNRDMISAIKRICEMAGMAPATFPAKAPAIRATLAKIRPAAHGVSQKTWANLLSRFRGLRISPKALAEITPLEPLGRRFEGEVCELDLRPNPELVARLVPSQPPKERLAGTLSQPNDRDMGLGLGARA